MISPAQTPDEYYESLPDDRRPAMLALHKVIADNLPEGFQEAMRYGMPGWEVPLSIYPAGYHTTGDPLPFLSIAAQKNFYGVYAMHLYGDEELMTWFRSSYEATMGRKLDAGKSCLRFKKPDHIPYELIGQLAAKVTPAEYAKSYAAFDPRNKQEADA